MMQNNTHENTPEVNNIPRFSRRSALWLYLIAAAGLIFAGGFANALIDRLSGMQKQWQELIINLFYYLPFVALPVCLLIKKDRAAAPCMRPAPLSLGNMIFISVLAALSVFFVSNITTLWCIPLQKLGLNVFARQMQLPTDRGMLMLCVITAAVIPGVCEELLFRGVVLPGFEEEGSRRAIRVSALLFAMLHGSVTGLPGQFLLGAIIARLVIFTDSIYAGVVFHTVYNAMAIIIESMQSALPAELRAPADIIAALGGLSGIFWMVVETLLVGWMLRFSLNVIGLGGRLKGVRALPHKPRKFEITEKILLVAALIAVILLYAGDIAAMVV